MVTWFILVFNMGPCLPLLDSGASFLRLSCNLDNIAATHAIIYTWLGVAISSPIIGWLSDFIGRRCIIMTICGIAGAIAIIVVILLKNIDPIF